jgi:Tol biopolymer transport system component
VATRAREDAGDTHHSDVPELRSLLRLATASLLLLTASIPAAGAAEKPARTSGRLAVVQGGDSSRIKLMHQDGSHAKTLVPTAFGVQSPTWRPDGHALAFVASRRDAPGIYVVSDDGTGLRPLIARGRTGTGDPAFSPDGRFIAYSRAFRGSEIWIARADGSHPRLLIRNGRENIQPTWSPDGKRIAFVQGTASGDLSIRTISVASGREEPLTSGPDWDVEPSWSPAGGSIAFVRRPQNSDRGRLAIVRVRGGGVRVLAPHIRDVAHVAWSPDGRQLAFTRKLAPDSEVFRLEVRTGRIRRVTRDRISDTEPAWGPTRR